MKKELEHYSEILGLSDYDEWSYCAKDGMWYEDSKEVLPMPGILPEHVTALSCQLKVGYSVFTSDGEQFLDNDENDGDGNPLEEFAKYLLKLDDYSNCISSVVMFSTPGNIISPHFFGQKYFVGFGQYSMWYLEEFIEKLKTQSYATQYIEDWDHIKLIAWTNKKNRTRFVIYSYDEYSYLQKMFDISIDRDLLVHQLNAVLDEWKKIVRDAIIKLIGITGKKIAGPHRDNAITHFFPDLIDKEYKLEPQEKIREQLRRLENERHIKIIYAIESGSRMWGFASRNSDYDVRFLYINTPQHYLSVSKQRDCIEYADKEYDLDMVGWDIKKALELLQKSNMSLYEWTNSPMVYTSCPEMEKFRELAKKYWSIKSLIYSYIHLATRNYKEYILNRKNIKLKKYLYIIRVIAACICMEKTGKPPAITMDELTSFIKAEDKYVARVLDSIVQAKKNGEELLEGWTDARLNSWIEEKIKYYEQLASHLEKTPADYTAMDQFLYQIVYAYAATDVPGQAR